MILTSFDQSLVTTMAHVEAPNPTDESQEFTLSAYIDKDIVLGPNERCVVSTGMFCKTSATESLLLFPSEELLVAGGCLIQLIWPPLGELKVLVIHVGNTPEYVTINPGQTLGTLVAVQMS
jgi:dUTPase